MGSLHYLKEQQPPFQPPLFLTPSLLSVLMENRFEENASKALSCPRKGGLCVAEKPAVLRYRRVQKFSSTSAHHTILSSLPGILFLWTSDSITNCVWVRPTAFLFTEVVRNFVFLILHLLQEWLLHCYLQRCEETAIIWLACSEITESLRELHPPPLHEQRGNLKFYFKKSREHVCLVQ